MQKGRSHTVSFKLVIQSQTVFLVCESSIWPQANLIAMR